MRIFSELDIPGACKSFIPTMIVVQARLGSTRLPGKIFKPVLNKPLLSYQIERLGRVTSVQGIVIATTTNVQDQPIVDYCNHNGLHCISGSEDDVLSRYIAACDVFGLDVVVRVTSDCPLIDPDLIEKGVRHFLEAYETLDYLSICHNRSYPIGMDFEIMRVDALKKAYFEAQTSVEKEHVTPYIWKRPELFRLANMQQSLDESSYRLTVDTQEDYLLIQNILESLYPKNPEFTLKDVMSLLEKHPDWAKSNAHVVHKHI